MFPVMELDTDVGAERLGAVAEGKVLLFGVAAADELFVGAGVKEEGVLGLPVVTGGGG